MTFVSILIVEDEPIIALDIEQRLLNLNYAVAGTADSAESALALVVQSKPDLVLMDIQLQDGEDGIAVAAEIRDRFGLPIVFLTAHADAATLDRAIASKPYGYIIKPFETHNLSTAIEIALSRHRAEQAIQQALERERELNNLKSHFVSIVSHEFRNPLNVILFSLDLLHQYDGQLSPDKKELYFSRARGSVNRMRELLEQVLIVGRAELGKLECQPTPIDLRSFCQELIEETQSHTLTANPVHFICDYQISGNRTYLLDENLLRHILSNLLSNAVKYSPTGGEVHFTLTETTDTLMFFIQDEGIGIPAADQVGLFDSFQRGSNVHNIPGSGLGLSIVKQCVEALGGEISVQSEVERGSLFTVRLPLLNPASIDK